jgi:monofunctional glycosyltransferase
MKKLLSWILRFILKLSGWFFLVSVLSTILFRFVIIPVTPLMLIRSYDQITDSDKELKLKKEWVSIENISSYMPRAVIAAEDQNFENHFGLDLDAIEKAQDYNTKHKGKKMRGASTITQQTAKNVFLWPSRSWLRKGFEVYFTLLIEVIWSKERIMEVYLNVIEMGEGVYGIEAASQEYFNKPAAKLKQGEAALIAACLPNPRRWQPNTPTNYIINRKKWIVKQMNNLEIPEFLK